MRLSCVQGPALLSSQHVLRLPCAQASHSEGRHCLQVRLRPDERYGVVRFGTGDAVQSAIDALHGTKICGEKINVTRMDPLMAPHNSKRLRRAPTPAEHMLSRTF